MHLQPLTPAENQLLVKRFWYKDPLTAQEEDIVARVAPISQSNIEQVLAQREIDIYLGTSMRGEEQYASAIKVYNHLVNKGLKVFPPFFMTSRSRLAQSELEAVMLDRSRKMVGVYNTVDTFGLDSEVVEKLLSGRPTFLYLVPQADPELQATQDRRHRIFHDVHPRMLVGTQDILHGPHVTKSLDILDACLEFDGTESGKNSFTKKDGYSVLDCSTCESTIVALRTIR